MSAATDKDVIDVPFDVDQSQVDLDLEEALNQAFSSIGEDKDKIEVHIKVYRAPEGGSRRRWLFDLSEGEFSDVTKVLRDRYGSGTYEVRIMVGGRIYRRLMTEVEAPSDVDKLSMRVAGEQSPQTKDVLAMLQAMFAQQQESQRQQIEVMTERMRSFAPVQSGTDPTQMLTSMVSAMAAMQQLTPQQDKADPMGMFEKMMDLQIKMQTLTGSGESTGALGWAALARDFLPALADITKNKQQLQLQTATRQRVQPQIVRPRFKPPEIDLEKRKMDPKANPQLNLNISDSESDSPELGNKIELEKQEEMSKIVDIAFNKALIFLVNKADQNRMPDVYAEVTLDTVEDWNLMEPLVQILESENWFEALTERVPEIAHYREWFTELRKCILESLTPEGTSHLTGDDDKSIDNTELSTGYPQSSPQTYPQDAPINAAEDATKAEGGEKNTTEQSNAATRRQSGNTTDVKADEVNSPRIQETTAHQVNRN